MALLQANRDQREQFSVVDVEGLNSARDAVKKYLDELDGGYNIAKDDLMVH